MIDHTKLVERELQLIEQGQKVDTRVCPRCAWGRWYSKPDDCLDYPDRVHQGDIIVIPKGAVVLTYAKREIFEAGRTYKVKINHFIGRLPRWAGEAGYWTWTEDWEVTSSRSAARSESR